MNLVVKATDHNRVKVDWVNYVGQKRSLNTDNVPSDELIRARHGQQSFTLKDTVPCLNDMIINWNRPYQRYMR